MKINSNFSDAFSEAWWEQVIAAWNVSKYKMSLANFGLSGFDVLNTNSKTVWIYWNHSGDADRRSSGDSTAMLFSASSASWREFIEGKFTASTGVLQGRILFKGSVIKMFPYTLAFNNLARISRDFL